MQENRFSHQTLVMKWMLSFMLVLLLFQVVSAQRDSTLYDTTERNGAAFRFDINYLSNNVYLGRKDSLSVPYLSAGVRFTAPIGFFAAADASFLTKQSRLDVFTLEAGYDFFKNNFDAGFSATQYFYNNQSTNVKAELTSAINAYAGYTFFFIRPSLSAWLSLGHNKPDYTATFGLEHDFVSNNEAFSFTPAFYLNASTQNYYDSYYGTRYGRGPRGRPVVITAQALGTSTFQLLDYELSATTEYKVKGFSFYFIPTVAFPEHPVTVVATTKPQLGPATTRTFTEKLENSFYWYLGVSYRLRLKKHWNN